MPRIAGIGYGTQLAAKASAARRGSALEKEDGAPPIVNRQSRTQSSVTVIRSPRQMVQGGDTALWEDTDQEDTAYSSGCGRIDSPNALSAAKSAAQASAQRRMRKTPNSQQYNNNRLSSTSGPSPARRSTSFISSNSFSPRQLPRRASSPVMMSQQAMAAAASAARKITSPPSLRAQQRSLYIPVAKRSHIPVAVPPAAVLQRHATDKSGAGNAAAPAVEKKKRKSSKSKHLHARDKVEVPELEGYLHKGYDGMGTTWWHQRYFKVQSSTRKTIIIHKYINTLKNPKNITSCSLLLSLQISGTSLLYWKKQEESQPVRMGAGSGSRGSSGSAGHGFKQHYLPHSPCS